MDRFHKIYNKKIKSTYARNHKEHREYHVSIQGTEHYQDK